MILTNFDLQVIPMLPTKFQVSWPFGSGEDIKEIDFQDGRHTAAILGFPFRTIFTIFNLQVTTMLPTFQAKWFFGSGEEVKNIFSR